MASTQSTVALTQVVDDDDITSPSESEEEVVYVPPPAPLKAKKPKAKKSRRSSPVAPPVLASDSEEEVPEPSRRRKTGIKIDAPEEKTLSTLAKAAMGISAAPTPPNSDTGPAPLTRQHRIPQSGVNPYTGVNMSAKSRAFCFTLFGTTQVGGKERIEWLFNNSPVQHIVAGWELAPTTGNPHWQGHIYFKNTKTLRSVITLLTGAYVEVTRTLQEAIAYCMKDKEYVEFGTRPASQRQKGAKEVNRWQNAFSLAKQGEFELVHPQIAVQHFSCLTKIHTHYKNMQELEDTTERHIWLVGPTGTGKSRYARSMAGGAHGWFTYLKGIGKWWCGYEHQPMVLIDDIGYQKPGSSAQWIKNMADRYAFRAEVKGSTIAIRPRLIVVTSNYWPEQLWPVEEDHKPLRRRFKVVWCPDAAGDRPSFPVDGLLSEEPELHPLYVSELAKREALAASVQEAPVHEPMEEEEED